MFHIQVRKLSFTVQDLIREQSENLTTMVHNMSMQKEENNRQFKLQSYPKRGRGQNRQNFSNRDRNRSYSRDAQRQNFRPNYKGQSQNRCVHCGNDSRRGNYNRNDSRDRGDEVYEKLQ